MIEATLELSDLVAMHKKHNVIYSIKIWVNGLPVAKTLIKYNNNSSEENDEEERKLIYIEFTKQNADPEMMKVLLTLDDQMYKKKTRKILFWLT